MRRHFFTLLALSIVSCVFAQPAICSYKYRKRITFDPAQVAGPSDLVNFPALISITTDNNLRTVANSGHVENANGFDIVFTADDGVTLLSFQSETYVASSGKYTAWVRIPVLSTSQRTSIYMYYGNTGISADQSSSTVWSNYHGVWHLQNNSMTDNSGNAYTITNNGTTNQSPAFINDGRANNGSQWLEVASSFPNITTDFSMSGWVFTADNTRAGQRVFCDDVNNSGGYALSIGDNGTGCLRFFSRNSNPISLDSPNNIIANNTWYYITAVADISHSMKYIYLNGVQVASGAFTNAWGTDNGNCSAAGETASGETGNRLNGRIDEVRVAKSALSADWILTEYNNQNSPSTFYSISAEPEVFTGGSNANWNTNANWASGAVPGSNADVILTGTGNQPNLNANVQMTSVWILPSTTLTLNNSRTLSLTHDVTNCGVINGNNNSVVNLNSTSAAAQNQYLSGNGQYNLEDLTINNTFTLSPAVVLNQNVTVDGDLTLTSGLVYTSSSNILALGTGAASTSGSSSSFISGPMTKAGTANFTFPVGKGSRWRRLRVSGLSATANFRAEYFSSAYTSTVPVTSPLTRVSSLEYWQLDRLSGAGNANVTLFWESASASGITDCSDITIGRWTGSSWTEAAAASVGGSSCSGSGPGSVATSAVVSAFNNPFTFGSKSAGVNPLPVELTAFEASCSSRTGLFHWTTASETNNAFFQIEYSSEGQEWVSVSQVKGAGNSRVEKKYSTEITPAKEGYYHLKQIDETGAASVFQTLYLDCADKPGEDAVALYPNPNNGHFTLDFRLTRSYHSLRIKIRDLHGRTCSEQQLALSKGTTLLDVSAGLMPGVYILSIEGQGMQLPVKRLIVN